MRRFLPLVALFLAISPLARAATLNEDIIVTGQRAPVPGANVWYEGGFAEFPALGPQFAKGLVIWNHPAGAVGIAAAKPISGLAALGWDVIRLQRNPRLATSWENRLAEVRESLTQEVADAKAAGYQRVILAGEGFGGALALEAAKTIDGLYGVVALAPNTGDGPASVDRTWSQLSGARAGRILVLFPKGDKEVLQERGAKAHELLAARSDLSYVLVDETSGVSGSGGAESLEFATYATCMGYFMAPDATLRTGEFHCGSDELPAALARMGAKPHGGETWFGYSNRGLETYVELPATAGGQILYGWGYGAEGRGKPAVKSYEMKPTGAGFTFNLNNDLTVRGLKQEGVLRLVVDLPDGTRSSVMLHRLSGNS